jgi:hypothetical protein
MSIDEMVAVLQAFKDGKKIQVRAAGRPDSVWWTLKHTDPSWNFVANEYRVLPEPRTVWVNEYAGRLGSSAHETKADADHVAFNVTHKAIQFVEVV